MRRDFSERADDRVSVARTEHENRLGLPFASRTLVFPFADEANVAAVGREIGGRQKGPARAGSFHCRCKQFAGGEGLAQMPRFDSGAIDRAALGNGIVFFYIGRVSDGQIGL